MSQYFCVVKMFFFLFVCFFNSLYASLCVCLVTESCPALCNPMDCSLPGSSVHAIFKKYWSGLPLLSPRDLPNPGIKAAFPALHSISCIAGEFFTHWAIREAQYAYDKWNNPNVKPGQNFYQQFLVHVCNPAQPYIFQNKSIVRKKLPFIFRKENFFGGRKIYNNFWQTQLRIAFIQHSSISNDI